MIVDIRTSPYPHPGFFIKPSDRVDWQIFRLDVITLYDLPLFS